MQAAELAVAGGGITTDKIAGGPKVMVWGDSRDCGRGSEPRQRERGSEHPEQNLVGLIGALSVAELEPLLLGRESETALDHPVRVVRI